MMSNEDLVSYLIKSGVVWDRQEAPDLDELDDGSLCLTICISYSHDMGYSMYYQGVGRTLDECIKDLHYIDV